MADVSILVSQYTILVRVIANISVLMTIVNSTFSGFAKVLWWVL